jgi:hypothetical protein
VSQNLFARRPSILCNGQNECLVSKPREWCRPSELIWKNLELSFSMGCILPCFGGSGGGLVNHLSFLPRCAFWWQPRLISVCLFIFLIFDKSTWRNVRIKKDWKLGDQIYFVASKEGPICHCCVANVQSRDGGPIPFALASHVASCLDSPGISWLHVVSPPPLLGCFFFFPSL